MEKREKKRSSHQISKNQVAVFAPNRVSEPSLLIFSENVTIG